MSDSEDYRNRSHDRGSRGARSSTTHGGRSSDRSGRKANLHHRVLVSNIAYEVDWKGLKDLFKSQIGNVSYVDIFVDHNNKSRGVGVVEFKDEPSKTKCLETMSRFEFKGRNLAIRDDSHNKRDIHGVVINNRSDTDRNDFSSRANIPSLLSISTPPSGSATNNNNDYGNTYGLSPKFLEGLDITGPLIHRVFVSNLDFKVDEKKLTEVFKLAGKVVGVDLVRDASGNSRGFAVIEYDHPVESVQAISMFHNQQLYDRKMGVRMDRERYEGVGKLPEGLQSIGLGLGAQGEPLRDIGRNIAASAQCNHADHANSNHSILGASPNQLPLAVNSAAAAALNNLVGSNSSLVGLANSQAAALQASLASVGLNPLLSGNDLSLSNLSSSMLSSPLNPSQSMFNQSSFSSNVFPRSHDSSGTVGNGNFPSNNSNFNTSHTDHLNRGTFSSRGADDYDQFMAKRFKSDPSTDFRQSSYSTGNNGSQNSNQAVQHQDTIVISNLPPSVTRILVKEKFKSFGEILHCEMHGHDSAIVRFIDSRCAMQAIAQMDCARFDGRTIDVRYY